MADNQRIGILSSFLSASAADTGEGLSHTYSKPLLTGLLILQRPERRKARFPDSLAAKVPDVLQSLALRRATGGRK